MTENIDIQHEEDRVSDATSDLESDLTDDVQETDAQNDGQILNPTPDLESDLTEDVEETDIPEQEEKTDTFPREYVEKLRDENAKYRQRAQRSDDLAQRLHEALVAATGRLQDPSDLVFNEEHLDDPEALQAAIEDLLARKPHLASRRPYGDIGQGPKTGDAGEVDLAALLRSRA